jgi:hypothetical protein
MGNRELKKSSAAKNAADFVQRRAVIRYVHQAHHRDREIELIIRKRQVKRGGVDVPNGAALFRDPLPLQIE